MNKIILYLSSLTLAGFLMAGLVFAQTDVSVGQAVPESTTAEQAETVTAADLGVENTGILPTNPFYFLKNWRNGIQLIFTFNPVKKAELELKVVDQKAAELQKLQETRPDDEQGIELALQNYQQAQERLKEKLEALKETSQNPNIEKLLDKLADRVVKHEKLMDELAAKFEGKDQIQNSISGIKEKIEEVAVTASKKDEVAKFVSKLERALIESKGGELKNIRSVEILDRLGQKAPEELRQSLEKLRQDFIAEFQKDLDAYLKGVTSAVAQQGIVSLPGDPARRSLILKEIKETAKGRAVEVLDGVKKNLDKVVSEEKNIVLKATEQIKVAEERIGQLDSALTRATTTATIVRDSIKTLLSGVKEALAKAKAAFADKKYGEAFGQAQSAEVRARNALKMLEEKKPELENLQGALKEVEARINKYGELIKSRGYTIETQPKIFDLMKIIRSDFDLAKDALAKNDLAGVKSYVEKIRTNLSVILELIRVEIQPVKPVKPNPAKITSEPKDAAD